MNEIENYPDLPLSEWQKTNDTVHLWTQIVGKIRITLTPLLNQWWNVPLYVSPRGQISAFITFFLYKLLYKKQN